MDDIIEKLGITPLLSHRFYADIHAKTSEPYCKADDVREVEQQRNEMLERDIVFMSHLKRILSGVRKNKYDNPMNVIQEVMRCFDFTPDIRITGRKFDDIRDLI